MGDLTAVASPEMPTIPQGRAEDAALRLYGIGTLLHGLSAVMDDNDLDPEVREWAFIVLMDAIHTVAVSLDPKGRFPRV